MQNSKTFTGQTLNELLSELNNGQSVKIIDNGSSPEEIKDAILERLREQKSSQNIPTVKVIGQQSKGNFSVLDEIRRQINAIQSLTGDMFGPTPDGTTYEPSEIQISRHLVSKLRAEYLGSLNLGHAADDLKLVSVLGLPIRETSLSSFNQINLGFPVRVSMKAITPEPVMDIDASEETTQSGMSNS